jgi:predicted RNA binding protein YcfA (HicA-like mRNA interferase family)
MKRRDLVRKILRSGGSFVRSGSNHDVYRGANGKEDWVPRHREIKENTANGILKKLGIN